MINLSSLNKGLVGHWRLGTDFQKVDANVIPSQADSTFESWTGNWYVAEGGSGSTVAKDGATDTMLMTIGGSPATFLYAQLSNAAVGTIQANSTVIFTADVYIPSATVIDACYLYRSGFTGVTTISSEAADLSLRDQWQTLRMVLHFDTDVTGTIVCAVNVSGGSSGTLKWDNVTVKQALIADQTPYGNHAENYGVTFTTDRKGQADRAGALTSANSNYLDLGALFTGGESALSISTWVKSSANSDKIIEKRGSSGPRYFYMLRGLVNSNNYAIYCSTTVGNSTYIYTAEDTASTSGYDFVVGTFDLSTNTLKIYVNGSLLSHTEVSVGSLATEYPVNTAKVSIGRSGEIDDEYFDGDIESLRMYNRILSADEVLALYNSYRSNLEIT